ncbi:DUF6414 family protein [Deinococcus humi]|uniref:Uncharacterized protein n=1 Tax=Deinococcus humi TaxID=662880 RepID=A0A7W8NDY4_9DEIO|nr:hypothetical protein [Deinococcus humi]MBB5362115.1 hypothetical protein [Deinococcus humi]GGO21995.1 hypothetical protein GCM10008949_08820 [Deinococcus humi]
MSGDVRPSSGNGSGTDPREIIYLDRGRLLSYASQLFDGVTVMRRLLEASKHGDIISKIKRERETFEDARRTGSAGVSFGAELRGEAESSEGTRTTITTGGDQALNISYDALLEDKAELDNVLLVVERELEARGHLTDFTGEQSSGLIRFRGVMSFVDWTILHSVLLDTKTLVTFSGPEKPLKPQEASGLAKMLKILSLSDITAHMTSEGASVIAPLNPEHLTLTLEQMRAIYLTNDIQATLLAFSPPSATGSHNRATMGLGGAVDFAEVFRTLTGAPDYSVQPIALYIEL